MIETTLYPDDWNKSEFPMKGTNFSTNLLKYITIHWPGANGIWWNSFEDWLVRSHIDYTVNRGYSLGYSYAVDDVTGRSATIRGTRFRAASNGDSENKDDAGDAPNILDNKELLSIIWVAPMTATRVSDKAKAEIDRLIRSIKAEFPDKKFVVNGHQNLDWTGCPGDVMMSFISDYNKGIGVGTVDNDPKVPVTGSGVFLRDIELLGSKSYRLGNFRFPAGNETLHIPVGIVTDAILASITVIGKSDAGWLSVTNMTTSQINWEPTDRIEPAFLPVVTLDGNISLYKPKAFSCEVIIDVLGIHRKP